MRSSRNIARTIKGRHTSDGAGVKLTRMFANREAKEMDPFLLLDIFGSNRVEDYIAGFPLHPHRGIETVTYMIDGFVDHKDSIGNKGTIGPGDVQWMTAGSGIMHEEMPRRSEGWMRGLQLWVNLPRAKKMTSPKYRGIGSAEIPLVELGMGSWAKVLSGELKGTRGPIRDLAVNISYFDVHLGPGAVLEHDIPSGMKVFIAIYEGSISAGSSGQMGTESVLLLKDGDYVSVSAGSDGANFILAYGPPLNEPIAWGGPIVMNTEEELDQAFLEIQNHTFIT